MTMNAKAKRLQRRAAERQEPGTVEVETVEEVAKYELTNPCPYCGRAELRPLWNGYEFVPFCYRCGQ